MLSHIPPRLRRWPKKATQPSYRPGSPEHPPRDGYDKTNTAIAVIGLLVLILYTGFSGWQTFLTREQLKLALGQQRAWLKFDMGADGDLTIDPKNGMLGVFKLTISNVGSVPANEMSSNVSLHFIDIRNADPVSVPELDECHVNRHPVREFHGAAVFPGDSFDLIRQVASIDRKTLNQLMEKRPSAVFAVAA